MDRAGSNGQAAEGGPVVEDLLGAYSIGVCCWGGGIWWGAFNLGALLALPRSPAYERVTTVAAVSGGSYIAAGHALTAHRLARSPQPGPAGGGTGTAQLAYALRSPEEEHLRDHSRYLLPSWPVSAFGVLGLLLGLVVNLVLVGACLWVGGRLLGVLLRATGVLRGLGTEDLQLVKALVDINHTSMHRYYRDRLAAAYAYDRTGTGGDVGRARLSELNSVPPVRNPIPELVICAAANCTGRGQQNVPPGRGAVSFTFTPTSVGLSVSPHVEPPDVAPAAGDGRTRRVPTESYEACVPGFGLFDAVAVSGAAVSPVMGKITQPTKRVLFALGNVRLGVWLPSPHVVAGLNSASSDERRKAGRAVRRRLLQPDLRRLWAEAAGTLHIDGKWMYVTDGGHYDNLGLVEAVRRRPGAIVVFDASGDPQGRFSTLGQAVALARTECACDITISPADIDPDPTSRLVPTTVAVGSFCYPGEDERPRPLLYARLGVTADHPWDLQAYLRDHPSFPTASTIQQLYDADEFEAYRAMGEATAAGLVSPRAAKVLPTTVTASHSS